MAIAVLIGTVSLGAKVKKPPAPRNLILISIDTLRADHLGCYGHPRPTSPAIDAIAAQGVVFDDASATSPWTKPSHASLLTGLYPSGSGVVAMNSVLAADVVPLAEHLGRNGFHTGAVVNSSYLTNGGLERGFRDFQSIDHVQGRREGSRVTEAAIAWLGRRLPGKFFAFFHYMDVHSDYASLPRYEQMFAEPYDGPATGATSQLYQVAEGRLLLAAKDVRHLENLYDASIRQVDDELGRLFAYLGEHGLLDTSLVVILSDHGEEFLEHGSVLHGKSQFQEVVRIPLIVRGPGVPQGTRVRTPVSLVDVMPTCTALLGVPVPAGLDGIRLQPFWERPAARSPERLLYFEADVTFPPPGPGPVPVGPFRAVRNERFKLHLDTRTKQTLLFDLAADPGERRDAAREHPELAGALRARLEQFLGRQGADAGVRTLTEDELERLRSLGYVQ